MSIPQDPHVPFSRENQFSGVQTSAPASQVEAVRDSITSAPFLFRDFPEEIMERMVKEEANGKWTGERLAARKPEVYAIVIRMLAAEFPIESIADLTKVSENSVRGIREREQESVEDNKKRMVGKMIIARERLIDRVIEKAPTMDGDRAAVAFGIISDKLNLEQGAPTARLEITVSSSVDDYRDFVAKMIDGAITVEPLQTGLVGGAGGQTRDLVGAASEVTADLQTVDSLCENASPTGEPTESADPVERRGGGGGLDFPAAGESADWFPGSEFSAKAPSPGAGHHPSP